MADSVTEAWRERDFRAVREVFDDALLLSADDQTFLVSYAAAGSDFEFGEPVRVEATYLDATTALSRVLLSAGGEDVVSLGRSQIGAYTRRSKSGKMVQVKAYWRTVSVKDLLAGDTVLDPYGRTRIVESTNRNIVKFRDGSLGTGTFQLKPRVDAPDNKPLDLRALRAKEDADPYFYKKDGNGPTSRHLKPGRTADGGHDPEALAAYRAKMEAHITGQIAEHQANLSPGDRAADAADPRRRSILDVLKGAVQEGRDKDTARAVAAGDRRRVRPPRDSAWERMKAEMPPPVEPEGPYADTELHDTHGRPKPGAQARANFAHYEEKAEEDFYRGESESFPPTAAERDERMARQKAQQARIHASLPAYRAKMAARARDAEELAAAKRTGQGAVPAIGEAAQAAQADRARKGNTRASRDTEEALANEAEQAKIAEWNAKLERQNAAQDKAQAKSDASKYTLEERLGAVTSGARAKVSFWRPAELVQFLAQWDEKEYTRIFKIRAGRAAAEKKAHDDAEVVRISEAEAVARRRKNATGDAKKMIEANDRGKALGKRRDAAIADWKKMGRDGEHFATRGELEDLAKREDFHYGDLETAFKKAGIKVKGRPSSEWPKSTRPKATLASAVADWLKMGSNGKHFAFPGEIKGEAERLGLNPASLEAALIDAGVQIRKTKTAGVGGTTKPMPGMASGQFPAPGSGLQGNASGQFPAGMHTKTLTAAQAKHAAERAAADASWERFNDRGPEIDAASAQIGQAQQKAALMNEIIKQVNHEPKHTLYGPGREGMSTEGDKGGVFDGMDFQSKDGYAARAHIKRLVDVGKSLGGGMLTEPQIHDYLEHQLDRRPTMAEFKEAYDGLKAAGVSVPDSFGHRRKGPQGMVSAVIQRALHGDDARLRPVSDARFGLLGERVDSPTWDVLGSQDHQDGHPLRIIKRNPDSYGRHGGFVVESRKSSSAAGDLDGLYPTIDAAIAAVRSHEAARGRNNMPTAKDPFISKTHLSATDEGNVSLSDQAEIDRISGL